MTRVENRGETTRGETTRGETSWGRNVLLPYQLFTCNMIIICKITLDIVLLLFVLLLF